MLSQSQIHEVVTSQKAFILKNEAELQRMDPGDFDILSSHALIISGIRRCGKSTFLLQQLQHDFPDAFYLNFEDPRLYGFELGDFQRLALVIDGYDSKTLFLDEIQVVAGWELFVRQKLDQHYQLVITGSNASLLSQELGTKLTGRHITKELFPFSYSEFCAFLGLPFGKESVTQYMDIGGFPEFVKTGRPEILHQLFDDLLVRDIVVRYGIRDLKSLQRLAIYLMSNVGKPFSGNQLRKTIEISATSTVMEYLSYMESCWLFFYVPRFSYSYKKQLVNPKKVYSIDTGLVNANSRSFSDDVGRRFENLVYLHLRRKYKEIYYYLEEKECDFVVFDKKGLVALVQVCSHLNAENQDRELDGLWHAMEYFGHLEGLVITLDQRDFFERDGRRIDVLPAWEYFQH